MNKNTEFNALINELLRFQRMCATQPQGGDIQEGSNQAILVARLLPGMDMRRWREFKRDYLSGQWCALPVEPALFSESSGIRKSTEKATHLAHLLLHEFVIDQIQREMLRIARTGGELSLMAASLLERESLANEISPTSLTTLDKCLVSCLTQCRDACDSLGYISQGRYILLLPGVSLLHARLMAEDMQKRFTAQAATICDATEPCLPLHLTCAVGIACADPNEHLAPPILLHQCEHALGEALAQPCGHIAVAGSDALDKRTTLVHSSEKRFLFFGSN